MKSNNWIHVVVLVLFLGVTGFQCARKTFPAKNGGYDIVLAIEKGTIEPPGVDGFLQNIETSLKEFSQLMHNATNGRFHINSAKVVIPYHWKLGNTTNISTTPAFLENYDTADIRLSRAIRTPHVENPTVCSSPGAYINLPLEFFNFNDTDPAEGYGQPWKSLLTAWARYRWGSWEEHGYPGDSKFPYFYKDPNAGWLSTGCSDDKLEGNFISINEQMSNTTKCEPDDDSNSLYPPPSECRFQPNQNQTASSSLSYFPWLPDIDSFCNESTHNPDAPNKQNLYCGYKSVLEAILHSEDSKLVTSPETTLPRMDFQVERENKKPLFYLLVDTSSFWIPHEVYEDIITEISSLYSDEALLGMIGKAAVFPTDETDMALEERISWTTVTVDESLNDFIATTKLYETTQLDRPGSFAVALHEVIDELRSIRNPSGANVLVLKHGFTDEAFGKVYESELVSILQTNKIAVHALEIRENIITPKLNLKTLSTESGGEYVAINPTTSVRGQVATFVSKIIDKLEAGKTVEHKTKPLFAGFLDVDDVFQIPLQTANFPNGTKIIFSLTLPRSSVTQPNDTWIFVAQPENITISTLPNEYEWNEPSDGSNRLVVRNEMNFPFGKLVDDNWIFQYSGCTPEDACNNTYVVVSYELPEENSSFNDDEDLNVEIFIKSDPLPVLIFAKITENSQPVIGLHSVEATITNFESQQTIFNVPLQDDGPNVVDVMSEDGVYSGYFVPTEDGQYVITVTLSGHRANRDFLVDHVHRDSAVQTFLPADQKTVGCPSTVSGCGVTGLSKSVLQLAVHPEAINLEMVSNFEYQIGRILDLDAVAMGNNTIQLTWTVPPLVFADPSIPDNAGLIWDIRSSRNATDLRDLDSFEDVPKESIMPNCNGTTFEQGQPCSAVVTDASNSTVYFALRLTNGTMSVEPSNVVGVVPSSEIPPPTTTTTTTIAPSTGSTTSSTRSTSTTTTEDPSQVNTTTTTTEPPFEYWYETKGGKWTLGLFGAGVALIFISVGAYALIKQMLGNRKTSDDTEQLKEMF